MIPDDEAPTVGELVAVAVAAFVGTLLVIFLPVAGVAVLTRRRARRLYRSLP